MKVAFTGVESGFVYTAEIEIDGVNRGYVQKLRGSSVYKAYSGGLLVAAARTLTELRREIAEHFEASA